MTKKILSFEEYAASKNFTSNDDIAEENEELCETCEKDPCICESSEEDEEDEDEESKESEESDDEEDEDEESDEHEKLESPDEEAKEDEEEAAGGEKAEDDQKVKSVAEMLESCYSNAVKEACDYDKDEYPDHTLESYLKENASLIAAMSAKTLEQAHAELNDEALEKEMYEACLNDMKESYCKKIEELKEAWSAQ
jgi:hypothetical protein